MTIKDYLQTTVDYIEQCIEENVNQELCLDAIAKHIGFSKYYLNSMFSIYTGLSIMAYVRRRKLCKGLEWVKSTERLSDVAAKLGYSSERAFSRAVTTEYGHSPSYYWHNPLPLRRKLIIYDLTMDLNPTMFDLSYPKSQIEIQKNLMEKGVAAMKNYLSDVRYEAILPMTVISGVAVGSEPEDQIISLMNQMASEYGIVVQRQFGFDSPVEGDQDATVYRGYEYWLVVQPTEISKLPSPSFTFEQTSIHTKQIPGYRYATLTIENPFENPFERIPGGWKALLSWLEAHDFKDAGPKLVTGNCLEEVITSEDTTNTVMHIYVPIDSI